MNEQNKEAPTERSFFTTKVQRIRNTSYSTNLESGLKSEFFTTMVLRTGINGS